MKKILSTFLVLILSLPILAGCGIEIPAATDISQTPGVIAYSTPNDSPIAPEDTQTEDADHLEPVNPVLRDWVEPDREFYPYYYLLDEPEQKAYALLYTGVLSGEKTISMGGFAQEDDILDVFTAVMNDHPEIFWVDYEFSYDSVDDAVWSVMPDYNSYAESLADNQARFEAAATDIIDAAAGMSDVEKERYVHDWLTEHVVYNMAAYDAQNAYSVLVDGRAVCGGYAIAFQYLMQRLNVPCWFCEGQGINPETGQDNHAWNIVVLDGEPYNVDVTWDDFEDEDLCFTYYRYYNVADDVFSEDHIREGLAASLPVCDATELSFEGIYDMTVPQAAYEAVMEEMGMRADDLISSKDGFVNRVKGELVSRGGEEFTLTFLVSDSALCDEIDRALTAKELEEPIFYAPAEALGLDGFGYEYSWQTIIYDFEEFSISIMIMTSSLYSV